MKANEFEILWKATAEAYAERRNLEEENQRLRKEILNANTQTSRIEKKLDKLLSNNTK